MATLDVSGAFFWNSGDPFFAAGVTWFGPYSLCLVGTLCATVGSAMWPKSLAVLRGIAGVGGDDIPGSQFGLFVALDILAAFVSIGLSLVAYRFCPCVRREIRSRGMTLKQYVGRMAAHLTVVSVIGYVGYQFLTWSVCATILLLFLKQERAAILRRFW